MSGDSESLFDANEIPSSPRDGIERTSRGWITQAERVLESVGGDDFDEDLDLIGLIIRHPIDQDLGRSLCKAACVCLIRHHLSPTRLSVGVDTEVTYHQLLWPCPSDEVVRSHRNEIDATEDGATAVILVCMERRLGLVALERAETESRADWLLGKAEQVTYDTKGWLDWDAIQPIVRLEVSGTDHQSLAGRLREKRKQVGQKGPGFAAVVGFERRLVRIEYVKGESTNVL